MSMHDWTRVDAGIFHAFHHEWISEISRALNQDLLPESYYALPEHVAAGFGPDVLTLQGGPAEGKGNSDNAATPPTATLRETRPQTRFTAETQTEFYRRKQSTIVVRHVSGDRVVAMLEILSPGTKSTRHAIQAFVEKVSELLESRVHLLILDPFPPGPRDPEEIHAAIWSQFEEASFEPPHEEPLTFVSYECDLTTRAYIEPVVVGRPLPDIPLFLEPSGYVIVPLEDMYMAAFAALPRRWQNVL